MKFSVTPVRFGSIGDLALELRKALTAIAAGWNVEHNPDGTHKHNMTVGLHADTHADGGMDEVALDASQITTGTLADARLSSNVVLENINNTFTETQTLSSTQPALRFHDTDAVGVNDKNWEVVTEGGAFYIIKKTDAWANQSYPISCYSDGNVEIAGDVSEKGRTVPMGHWIDVPFSAANFFTTTGGATWTVTAADYSYTLIGKTVCLHLVIPGTSTITGAPTNLQVTLPAAVPPITTRGVMGVPYTYSGVLVGTGLCQIHPAVGAVLFLTRDPSSTAYAAGSNGVYVQLRYSLA